MAANFEASAWDWLCSGSAAVAPVWAAFGGARAGYALSGVVFLFGTIGCDHGGSLRTGKVGFINHLRSVA